jgi:hypothetical protein
MAQGKERTKEQLYREAKRLGVKGRSKMNKRSAQGRCRSARLTLRAREGGSSVLPSIPRCADEVCGVRQGQISTQFLNFDSGGRAASPHRVAALLIYW